MNVEVLKNAVFEDIEYYILQVEDWVTGYLVLEDDSKYYGVPYDDIDIPIHGGWTYSDEYLQDIIEENDGVWVIGFDTAHYSDGPKEQNIHYVEQELQDAIRRMK